MFVLFIMSSDYTYICVDVSKQTKKIAGFWKHFLMTLFKMFFV